MDEKESEENMTKSEIMEFIKETISEILDSEKKKTVEEPVKKTLDEETKKFIVQTVKELLSESKKPEDTITEENVQEMVQKALEPLYQARGISTNLNNEPDHVQKSSEHYLHGII